MEKNSLKLLLVGIFFISCVGNENPISNQTDNEVKRIEDSAIGLERFSVVPNEIDGCGCSFFSSEVDKKDNKYICVNDFADLAFVKLNGVMVRFELTEHKDSSNIYLYRSEEHALKIEIIKKEPADYETSNIEGVITISSKKGINKQKFIGTCGC